VKPALKAIQTSYGSLKKDTDQDKPFVDLEQIKTPDKVRRRRMLQAQQSDVIVGNVHHDDPTDPAEAISEITSIELYNQQPIVFQNVNNKPTSQVNDTPPTTCEPESTAIDDLQVVDVVN